MTKLSSFYGQEKVTAILRASVIKQEPITKLAIISKDEILVTNIALAYIQALNCEHPVKGDACDECESCLLQFPTRWRVLVGTDVIGSPNDTILVSMGAKPGYTLFALREAAGHKVHSSLLPLFVKIVQGDETSIAAMVQALNMKYDLFVTQISQLLGNMIYLQNNVTIADADNSEVLSGLARNLPKHVIKKCFKLIWDSPTEPNISSELAILGLCIFMADLFNPKEYSDIMLCGQETPISTVESTTNYVKALTLDEMYEMALNE